MREKAGISQKHLAQSLGVTQGAVSQWEQDIAMPGADKLPRLARILGCTINDLFEADEKAASSC
ncbi:MAG: helix-turn-helix domain-containing protein [Candidatus Spyradocola sp.]